MHGFTGMIGHIIIKGIIYDIIFKLMRHLTLPEALGIGVLAIAGYWFFYRKTRRSW